MPGVRFNRRRCCRLSRVLVLSFLFSSLLAYAKDRPEDIARPLLKAAVARSLLSGVAPSPYGLRASFSVYGVGAKRVDGKYVSALTSTGDWAKQILFADYSDLEVAHGSTVWVKRSIAFQPLQAAIVQNAFSSPLHVDEAGDIVDRYFKMSDHNIELRCADLSRGKDLRTICVDPDQNLRVITIHSVQITYQYSDFRPAGKKFAPYRITATRSGRELLDVSLDKVLLDAEADSQLPKPPDGSIKHMGCLSPTLPILKHMEVPGILMSPLKANYQGQVMLYALIGSDGNVKDAVVTQTAGKTLDSSALDAVRHYQYEPARCGDTYVEFETEVPVYFRVEIRENQ